VKFPGLHHFILARGGQTYARLEFHVGPGGWLLLPVEVDFTRLFAAADQAAWRTEYPANVQEELFPLVLPRGRSHRQPALEDFGILGRPVDEPGLWNDSFKEDVDCGPAGFFPRHDEGGFHDDNF
jgi:hypothetical protein